MGLVRHVNSEEQKQNLKHTQKKILVLNLLPNSQTYHSQFGNSDDRSEAGILCSRKFKATFLTGFNFAFLPLNFPNLLYLADRLPI